MNRQDPSRREVLAASGGYALAALCLPDLDSITRRIQSQSGSPVRVGNGEVNAIRQMVKALGDTAAELGGGHARHLAVRYLTEDVSRWLNGTWTEAVGRELYAATAELVHLSGWMAQDEGNQGLAQQYYAHSYRLAAEARAPELAATALRGLAVQATELGHRAAAVRISEACVDQAKTMDDPKALAYYQSTLADAAARDGDRRTAIHNLNISQANIERAAPEPGESWASHFSIGRWAHHSGMILGRLGEYEAAQEHLHRALETHGLDRRRSRATCLADLGTIRLRQDNLDGALEAWTEFLDCAAGVRSVKVQEAVHDMRARLHRYRDVAGAADLDERARDLSS